MTRRRPPYKLISLLLQYPDEELLEQRFELASASRAWSRGRTRAALERFFGYLNSGSSLQLQQDYVKTFDLQKRSSLYLTYYTEGDTRKRGLALLRLKRIYSAVGLPMAGRELSDYLPAMLEFVELAPKGLGEHLLMEHRTALEVLRTHLRALDSPYLHLLDALCSCLPRLHLADLETVRRLVKEGPPHEEVGLQPFAPPEVMPAMASRR